jgi:hypothetical protein
VPERQFVHSILPACSLAPEPIFSSAFEMSADERIFMA